jgi:hypothetical protein
MTIFKHTNNIKNKNQKARIMQSILPLLVLKFELKLKLYEAIAMGMIAETVTSSWLQYRDRAKEWEKLYKKKGEKNIGSQAREKKPAFNSNKLNETKSNVEPLDKKQLFMQHHYVINETINQVQMENQNFVV